MKTPAKALLLLNRNKEYIVHSIHFQTGQVTLKESDKEYNTVSIKNVKFDYSNFTEAEWKSFYVWLIIQADI